MALASALEIPLDAAQKIAGKEPGEGYLLVPRSLPATVTSDDPERDAAFAQAAAARLERLNKLVKTEMKAILTDLGHETQET